MTVVFVDTGGFYAVLNPSDDNHGSARKVFQKAINEEWSLVTSNFVVAETHALLLVRVGRGIAAAWLRSIPAAVVRLARADEEKARRIIFRYGDKQFSYCDAASFALMERFRIRRVLAFDRNFKQYGNFELVAP